MRVFKGMDGVKSLLDKSRQKLSQLQLRNLTAKLKVKPVTNDETNETTNKIAVQGTRINKWTLAKTATVVGAVTVLVWGGNAYVHGHISEVYHVAVNGQELGTVKDKDTVERFKDAKVKELSNSSTDVRMSVNVPEIEFTPEKAFMAKAQEQQVMDKLSGYITAHPVGIEMIVDGKPMGVVKDESTANKVLESIKATALEKKKNSGVVKVLSASPASNAEVVELQKVEFVQKVDLKEVDVQPQDVMKPDEMQKKLETGDVQPTKYTVEKGDCVSCIAKKLDIPKQVIYQNNPTITDDMIKVGQQLDLTVLQPKLAVRTVEKVAETQEIQYETETQQDDSMRLGESEVIKAGQNGVKKVMIQVTKVNGLMTDETVLNEEVVQQPVTAVVRKGTKVVKGEGTGKFAWPVLSSNITSTFGTRWGAFHKGIDLTGNRNIMAADNGKVVFAGVKSGYGNAIILDHLNGYKTLYGHLSQIDVTVGKIVEKGEKIGYMGSTGDSTGIHLHFEVQVNEVPQNPLKYLNR
ncbi:peptidoglycan DD-metalloendopeptidase family protein [Paenibacillus sp. TAB 01]|uniref:peptidoglycan DD-metalloendopeptidase family protein n=1 Tax=Paenibacillus sp. TAB 01 TaxID=3368988 RepID=UPI003752166A